MHSPDCGSGFHAVLSGRRTIGKNLRFCGWVLEIASPVATSGSQSRVPISGRQRQSPYGRRVVYRARHLNLRMVVSAAKRQPSR